MISPFKFTLLDEKPISVPIARIAEGGVVDHEGTGILLRSDNRHFLTTAAHVLDDAGKHYTVVGGAAKVFHITRAAWATELPPCGERNRDPVDIGFFELEEDEVEALNERCQFYDIGTTPPHQEEPTQETIYRLDGYPASYNISDQNDHVLGARMVRVQLKDDATHLSHSPDRKDRRHWFIALRYSPLLLTSKLGDPAGCSGGAIWRKMGGDDLTLAGMALDYQSIKNGREGVFVGLRLEVIKGILLNCKP